MAVDGLSAFFLVPVFLVSLLGNLYGLRYWKQTEHAQNGRKLRSFYGTLTASMVSLWFVSGVLAVLLRRTVVERKPTWGFGYVAPSARIQYTSSSFAQMLVGTFGWVLRPKTHKPTGLVMFPQKADFHSDVADPVLDEIVLPAFEFTARLLSRFRAFQQGNIQAYLLYIFLALFALLFWR